MVGPGRPFDTDRFFVICANVVGGCMGTTGPASLNPAAGEPYGLDFPVVTIGDMVRAQAMLIDSLGIDSLFCWPAVRWAACRCCNGRRSIPIASSARCRSPPPRATPRRTSPFTKSAARRSWPIPIGAAGATFAEGARPAKGLAVARMAAHITYLSDSALHRRFGRNLQDRAARTFSFDADFQVESYLRHQGSIFVERFDPNSYLYMTRAMDYFDLAADYGGALVNAFRGSRTRFCVVSFTSDWLFPTSDSRALVRALNAGGASVSFVEIDTDGGHDAFLLDVPELFATTRGFIDAAARARGIS